MQRTQNLTASRAFLASCVLGFGGIALAVTRGSEPALASDQTGVYAVIDSIEFHPDESAPRSIKIEGAFSVAEGVLGAYYRAPRRGAVYLQAPEGEVDDAVAQWRDLAKLAGTGKTIAFSSRYAQRNVRVWEQGAAAEKPDWGTMGVGFGVREVESARWGVLQEMRRLCRQDAGVGAGVVAAVDDERPGRFVELRSYATQDDDGSMRYVFLVDVSEESYASPPIAASGGVVAWKAPFALDPGDVVRWGVFAVSTDDERSPIAWSEFVTGEDKKLR